MDFLGLDLESPATRFILAKKGVKDLSIERVPVSCIAEISQLKELVDAGSQHSVVVMRANVKGEALVALLFEMVPPAKKKLDSVAQSTENPSQHIAAPSIG